MPKGWVNLAASLSRLSHLLIPNSASKTITLCWLNRSYTHTPLALNTYEPLIASGVELAVIQDRVLSTNSDLNVSFWSHFTWIIVFIVKKRNRCN